MKLSRLFQPRNPLFWLMLALNALTPALAWVARNRPLNGWGVLLFSLLAVGNALLGLWLAWRLLRDKSSAGAGEPGRSVN